MKNIEKKKGLIIIIGAVIGIFILIKVIDANSQNHNNAQINYKEIITQEEQDEAKDKIIVYITGEVQNEGVIELEYGSRISNAIEKAGGITEEANLKNVNLAYELEDGQKIYIPNVDDSESEIIDNGETGIVENENTNDVININKATEEQLKNLDGIGENLSKSIIEYRDKNGKFTNIEDIMEVPGIGENKFNNIKENIKVK